jgi:hypothetical protein
VGWELEDELIDRGAGFAAQPLGNPHDRFYSVGGRARASLGQGPASAA